MNLSLTKDQKNAIDNIIDWYTRLPRQYMTLGGFAGTGKTTLISIVRKLLYKKDHTLKIAFCSYTGKSTQVLRDKLFLSKSVSKGDKISTIHGLIYESVEDKSGRVIGWRKRSSIEYDLIIVDEASMVNRDIWNDLLSFNIPILAVGDHGQLPPIEGKFNLMQDPDYSLEIIHRQAVGSPIIKLSQIVRQTGKIPVGKFGDLVIKYDRYDNEVFQLIEEEIEQWNPNTMFLVGMNHTRIKLNQQIREIQGIHSMMPIVGDRVICLRNNWESGIYNGALGTLQYLENVYDEDGNHHWYDADLILDDGRSYFGRISKYQFNSKNSIIEVDGVNYKDMGDLFDFGYVLTVHKAQGSQASKVVLFEERSQYMDDEQWQRWLYTAVTRAETELVIIG